MRRPIVVANWKMNMRAGDAQILAASVRDGVGGLTGVEVVLCPPAIWLTEVRLVIGTAGRVELGAQNMFYETEGAFTGEVSPAMVRDVARYVIVGHSERRGYFGEKDFDVNEKAIAALDAGLTPIICVGEHKKEVLPREPARQLKEALAHIPKKNYKDLIIAYEPIWAIGTGDNASSEYVAKVVTYLREIGLAETPVLYGGSVNANNVKSYACRPEIDGLLVGGASLKAAEFVKICQTWASIKHFRE